MNPTTPANTPTPNTPPNTQKPYTLEEIMTTCDISGHDDIAQKVCLINEEITQGLRIVQRYPKKITIWGSARLPATHPDYIKARELAGRLVKELDYTILTGGGPGIMEAANRGAKEAGGHSIGLNIQLPQEQVPNTYQTVSIPFHYFFTRKVAMAFAARMYVFFPGGYGTLDEFYEILTLVQTQKIHRVPIVCVGAKFWEPIDIQLHQKIMLSEAYQTISPEDISLYTITDDIETVMQIAHNAQMRV